jgi:hypothetical protein
MASMLNLGKLTLDRHREFLQRLCRTCGKRALREADESRGKVAKLASSYKQKIQVTFAVDIEFDEPDVHPKSICESCRAKLYLASKRSAYNWSPHPRSSPCEVCSMFTQQSKGGRPKKSNTGAGRPKKVMTPAKYFRELKEEMASMKIPDPDDIGNFTATSDVFICQKCKHFLRWPVALPCQHIFCLECIYHVESKAK